MTISAWEAEVTGLGSCQHPVLLVEIGPEVILPGEITKRWRC